MMLKLTRALLLSGVLALVSTAAHANPNIFTQFDLDQNGRLTAGEISDKNEREIIAGLDVDANGWVSPDEFVTQGTGMSLIEHSGIDARNMPLRWIDFTFVRFELGTLRRVDNEVIEGQYPLDPEASPAQVDAAKAMLRARFGLAWPATRSTATST